MTKDFAKPSTTRKPGDKKKPRSNLSASSKTKKAKAKVKNSSSATLKQNQVTPTANRTKPIILLVILISAFVVGLYYLQSVPPTQSISDSAKKTLPKKPINTRKSLKEKKTDTRFKFYDLLPESQIKPPQVEAYKFKEKNKKTNYTYIVQTGSFRSRKDAERQKATIAFKGIKADINVVTKKNGLEWYRVVAGPSTNRSKLNNVLDTLVSINIEPLVKKVKK